jgi:class 3 adenylate cyclase
VTIVSGGLVTILFTDLVGSTELASHLGDAAADALRRDHFASLREAVAATGGTEVKTIGDALMVSYPGAADALLGAATMQRAVERHNRRLRAGRLAMRIGISAGDATFEDGDWFGTPIVESSRLCAAADGGQILASDIVRVLAGSRTELELRSLGDLELKGLPAPLATCEVVWQIDTAGGAEIPLPVSVDVDPTFPFAGRVDHLERLTAAWKETIEGTRRAVLVSGEPGIGKTRLVTEVIRIAHDRGAIALWGRCDEEVGAPYAPFADALHHYVAVSPPDRVRAELGPLGGELVRILPELTSRVPGLAEPMRADADTERFRLFDSVADLLAEMSAAQPVVLVLDDVHWADKPSLLLLRHLLRSSTPMRLFVLATYRDTDLDRSHPLADVLADLRRQPGVERLDLQGLDEGEITTLMTKTAGHELDERALDLARVLHDETEGNPFFVGEVLRHLAESGAIVQREGRWTAGLEGIGIPEGIREVIGRRMSRLSDDVNRALAVAAVIGPTFDLATIEAAGGPGGDALFDALDEATNHNLIREVPGAVGRYVFAHALLRSTLYEELTTNRRVRMHWKIGEVLESRFASNVDAHLDELAYHFGQGALAGDPAKAVEYSRRAGQRAMNDVAFESAAEHFERALGSVELVDNAPAATRCDLLLDLAEARQIGGDERRRATVFEAAQVARASADPDRLTRAALVLVGTTSAATRISVDDELVALLDEALAALPSTPSPARARLLASLAVELQWGPERERRLALAREALEVARATADQAALNYVFTRSWAMLDGARPWVDEFAALLAEAEEVAIEIGDTVALRDVHHFSVWLAAQRGDRAEIDRRFDAYIRLVDQVRVPAISAYRMWSEAALAEYGGRLVDAERLVVEGVELAQRADLSDEIIRAFMGGIFYYIRLDQGRSDELVETIEGLVESQPGAPVWRIALSGALIECGRVEDARVHYMWLAADDCANAPRDVEYPVILDGLARMAYDVRPSDAVTQSVYELLLPFSGIMNWSGAGISGPNDLGLALTSATLGRYRDADAFFASTLALCEGAQARCWIARTHFDWGRVLADRGDTEGAREHTEIAVAMGEELGMNGPFGIASRGRALLESL